MNMYQMALSTTKSNLLEVSQLQEYLRVNNHSLTFLLLTAGTHVLPIFFQIAHVSLLKRLFSIHHPEKN